MSDDTCTTITLTIDDLQYSIELFDNGMVTVWRNKDPIPGSKRHKKGYGWFMGTARIGGTSGRPILVNQAMPLEEDHLDALARFAWSRRAKMRNQQSEKDDEK